MDQNVHSFSFIDDEKVILQQAKESEERWSQGKPNGEMDGLLVSIKDLLNVKGFSFLTHSQVIKPFMDPRNSSTLQSLKLTIHV
jgi:aspartyl-tRNA(Asn)/glutamyl-tRNA(Gln) amidotransferase subunit A